jgi:hypothetical protein
MKNLKEARGTLTWIGSEPNARDYLLQSGSEEFARLTWASSNGSLAAGQTALESWSFKRVGFFQPFISIRRDGSNSDLARVDLGATGSGAIQFTDAERYLWNGNLWRSEWTWNTPSGALLVAYRRDFSIDARAGEVSIPAEHLHTIHLPLLVVLGWYIIVSMGDEAEAATR